jgi:hypothetical protein
LLCFSPISGVDSLTSDKTDEEHKIAYENFTEKHERETHERYLRDLQKEEKPFTGFSDEDDKIINET